METTTSRLIAAIVLATAALAGVRAGSEALFYADNELQQSVLYDALPRKEKREMQQEILSLLGLHHRPKPATHKTDNSAPRYMIDLYKSFINVDGNEPATELGTTVPASTTTPGPSEPSPVETNRNIVANIKDADVIMSFVNHAHDKKKKRRIRHDHDKRLWFDVSEVSPGQDIIAAQLRLYRMPHQDSIGSGGNYTINVYEIVQKFDPEDRELLKLDSITVPSNQEGWIMINVTTAMANWIIYPHKNLGLFVSVQVPGKARDVSPLKIGIVGHKGSEDHQPFMTAFFKTATGVHIRKTRAARRRQKKQSSSYSDDFGWNPYVNFQDRHSKRSCQKRTLYVSFRDLGWQDWIIAPDGYAAFYCHGECSFPLNAHMNATNHAIVQTLVHLMNPYTVPKPCCAPTKLSAISVLYFDDNSNVILKKYKNMVVKSCGCH